MIMDERLKQALDRALSRQMTPEEVFDQRVSFASDGRNKDQVRRMLIKSHGWPREAVAQGAEQERAAIVKWLRDMSTAHITPDLCGFVGDPFGDDGQCMCGNLADAIEAGQHLKEEE